MNDALPLLLECDACHQLWEELMVVRVERFAGHDLDGRRLVRTDEQAICESCHPPNTDWNPEPQP